MMTKVSVIISTHNREEVLRETLDAMCAVDRDGLDVQWIIVDNNSSDGTPQLIDSFKTRLPLVHLFEPRPGKNCALNKAIQEVSLGEFVVFTDDDVTPQEDWLKQIVSGSTRWPDHAVFGGRIVVEWPMVDPPRWASKSWITSFGFAEHKPLTVEGLYPQGSFPFGPNMWVRLEVFQKVPRYDERIGPRPKNRIMGSETIFLKSLLEAGFAPVYISDAIVSHRVSASEVSPKRIQQRAWRFGRGLHYTRNPYGSRLASIAALALNAVGFVTTYLTWDQNRRVMRQVYYIYQMAWCVESLQSRAGPEVSSQ